MSALLFTFHLLRSTQEQGREPKDSLNRLELADMKKENEMLKTNINSLETEISKIKLRIRIESSQQRAENLV